MRFSTFISAAATLMAGVEGYLFSVGVPKTIKAGEVFNASVTAGSLGVRQDVMVWGYTRYDYEWNNFPSIGSVGNIFAKTNLNEVLTGSYLGTIPNLKIPEGTQPGDYAIQAVILGYSGVYNQPSLETYFWNVTIGDVTSEERNWLQYTGENKRSCTVGA
ncbi:hypothetical protein C8034_v010011 [Colletotrichum sidae]|uniref:Uncharacterized protein n=3 Tax=Colletotrichum orbiculare species complex TaxID=2707354 RepID=A0A4V3HVF2_COLTR|nr:hypothetical protein C8035_v010562 [Colletotrichum spinosum]TDZ51533.1 hypothetical protein CTRI78_v007619 [Colletotrichum trifolii]TEA10426.1 hypothetical protein C8034_v010011 [Colletotrichum sidae]